MKKSRRFLLIATLVTVASSFLFSCSGDSASEIEYVPVQLTEGGAWTFIDSKGERVGDQQWEFEPTVTYNGIFTARTDSGLTVYHWDGTTAKAIDSLKNLVSVGVLNEGLMPVTPAMQRIRIVDKKGNKKFELNPIGGKEISSCASQFTEGLLVVNTVDGKSGVIDKEGNVVIEPKYSEISDFNGGYALARNDDYEDYEKGPQYFIIDKEGNVTAVKGEFGYCEEGDCSMLSGFDGGVTTICGKTDSATMYNPLQLDVKGAVTKLDMMRSIQPLKNGSKIITKFNEDSSETALVGPDGQEILKASDDSYLMNLTNYVVLVNDRNYTVYNLEGQEPAKLKDLNDIICPGGKFGLFVSAGDPLEQSVYTLYDAEIKPIEGTKYYGISTSKFLETSNDEIVCQNLVTSAYVDITAAATKMAQMATSGYVKGKDSYYVGQLVKEILDGENARFYSGNDRVLTIPTNESGQLANGAGFWIGGTAKASAKIVAPTYQHYFEVHHYDYYGRAWGWNRTRQVGVHFNPSSKVESFDLQLHTNHASGAALRESIGRRLKKEGYTLVATDDNYDEYSNGSSNIIIYGSATSNGVGAILGAKTGSMSEANKQSLAATLF